MKILISGSSGLVGSALLPFLVAEGHQIVKLIRARSDLLPNEIAWDERRGILSPESLEGMDAVIHLAGENIANGRWTEEKKRKILDSRVIGTRLLCEALASLKHPPKVLISASATGYYGSRGKEVLTENSPRGTGFLADVCEKWEEATQQALDKGIRVVNLRIGMILSAKGGGLKKMLPPFKWGLGGTIGSGEQYISWIAIDDVLNVIAYALKEESLKGPVNVVSPNPVTNRDFTKTLGQVLDRPTWMTMPDFMVRWIFGEMGEDVLLSSTRVKPKVLEDRHFQFSYPELEKALREYATAQSP